MSLGKRVTSFFIALVALTVIAAIGSFIGNYITSIAGGDSMRFTLSLCFCIGVFVIAPLIDIGRSGWNDDDENETIIFGFEGGFILILWQVVLIAGLIYGLGQLPFSQDTDILSSFVNPWALVPTGGLLAVGFVCFWYKQPTKDQ